MSSGGLNWQRWKKKKPSSSPSRPTEGSHVKSKVFDAAVHNTQCVANHQSSEQRDEPSSERASASTSAQQTYHSPKDKSSRDCSSSKRRKKSKCKESSGQMAMSPSGQSFSLGAKQHSKVESRTLKDTPSRDSKGNGGKRATASETVSFPEGSGSSSSDPMDNPRPKKKPPELPGFYYDEEKKRYFRILPGHNIPSAVTPEMIRLKEAEKKRQTFLDGRFSSGSKDNARSKGQTESLSNSLVHLHQSRQKGVARTPHFQRLARENAVKHIRMKPSSLVTPFPDRYFDGESGYISHFEVDSKQKHVLMVVSDDYLSRLWQGEVVSARNPSTGQEETTIGAWTTVNILTTRNCKVTHTSWAQVKDGENMYALYAISGGSTSSVQLFKCPSAEDGVSHISYRYESNHEMAWTCAWSNSPTLPAHLAIGSTRKAVVVDTLSARKQKLHTCHSDVFSQVFSRKSPILYNGTRRGEVLGIDLRIPSHSHMDMTAVLRHSVSVCSMRLLQDENYMLASDMGGGIKLWDIRKCAVVQEFKGHYNENHHLPVKVDSTETIIYAVGQDKYTRAWSLRSGQLLHTIPCPSSCHEDNAPVAVYSQDLACRSGPGLFLGQERRIYWYPMR